LPEQPSAPGVQLPTQLPETHAWFVHAVAFCHDPVEEQVCGCWPLHCVCPGPHAPWQVPETQVVLVEHTDPVFCQVPVMSQVWGCWLLHRMLPGEHEPLQAPLRQPWFVHATAVPHAPDELQVCTLLPEHWVAPGVQEPEQAPPTHAALEQATAVPH
jgi:hypothetical protein